MGEHVLVGFSGGVDSAMTALLLRERGCVVHAAMMSVRGPSGQGCGHDGDVRAAENLARHIGVPLDVFDLSDAYRRLVLDVFREEYLAGRTPNPCILCNPGVKFGLLPEHARAAGIAFDRIATGHYARIEYREALGRHVLLRGLDAGKDQSYFLYRLDAGQLARTLFPLGGFHKTEVREMARARGLPVHDKPDSQDFYAGDYSELLGRDEAEGDIVDSRGKVMGRHRGYWRYTPGQRKGLGVAYHEPLYVIRVEPAENRVVVGTRDEQLCPGCRVGDLRFPGPAPEAGATLMGKLRSAQPLRGMTVADIDGDGMTVRFAEPIHGVAPGQSLVMYDGDMVVGGGVIREAVQWE